MHKYHVEKKESPITWRIHIHTTTCLELSAAQFYLSSSNCNAVSTSE